MSNIGKMDWWVTPAHKGGVPDYGGARNIRTAHSSLDNGALTLDPSIRTLQDKGLSNMQGIYGDIGSATDRFLTDLRGNQGAYMQARVNPVLQKFATLRGEQQQNLGLRKLGGSSFGEQSMRNLEMDATRSEGDARALATRETGDAELGAIVQRAAIQAGLNGENYQVAAMRLQEELAGLGLSKAQIDQMMGQHNQFVNQTVQNYLAQTDRFNAWMGAVKSTWGSAAGGGGNTGGKA